MLLGSKMSANAKKTVVFNMSKNEIFRLTENYKTVHRKLKLDWRVEV